MKKNQITIHQIKILIQLSLIFTFLLSPSYSIMGTLPEKHKNQELENLKLLDTHILMDYFQEQDISFVGISYPLIVKASQFQLLAGSYRSPILKISMTSVSDKKKTKIMVTIILIPSILFFIWIISLMFIGVIHGIFGYLRRGKS